MTRKLYDKLVRDRIPEIIRESGGTCGIETIEDDNDFRLALRDRSSKKPPKRRQPMTRTSPPNWLICARSLTR